MVSGGIRQSKNNQTHVCQSQPVMQWRLGAAKGIQALIFVLSHRLDSSRHFSANFFVISNRIRLLNSTDCFRGECFALDSNNSVQIFSKPLAFLSHQVFFTQTHIPLANAVQCFQRRRAQALFNLPLHYWSQRRLSILELLVNDDYYP